MNTFTYSFKMEELRLIFCDIGNGIIMQLIDYAVKDVCIW